MEERLNDLLNYVIKHEVEYSFELSFTLDNERHSITRDFDNPLWGLGTILRMYDKDMLITATFEEILVEVIGAFTWDNLEGKEIENVAIESFTLDFSQDNSWKE